MHLLFSKYYGRLHLTSGHFSAMVTVEQQSSKCHGISFRGTCAFLITTNNDHVSWVMCYTSYQTFGSRFVSTQNL